MSKKSHEKSAGHAKGDPESDAGHPSGPAAVDDEQQSLRYAEFKLLLKPEELRQIADARELWTHARHAVREFGVSFEPTPGDPVIHQRDVMFYDTPKFDLYENHFILRRRTHFRDGWTTSHDELTFKYRHPDVDRVADIDVRPGVHAQHQVKFKREILPLTNEVGGSRHIYARNCVMAMPPTETSVDVGALLRLFPVLQDLASAGAVIELVNRVTVNETLTEFGVLDFGKRLRGKVSLALWRDTATSAPIVSELGFQIKFGELVEKTSSRLERIEEFFRNLQHFIARWLLLGTTKTSLVYRHSGREVGNRE